MSDLVKLRTAVRAYGKAVEERKAVLSDISKSIFGADEIAAVAGRFEYPKLPNQCERGRVLYDQDAHNNNLHKLLERGERVD